MLCIYQTLNHTTVQWQYTPIQWQHTTVWWQYATIQWQFTSIRWQYASIQWQYATIWWQYTLLDHYVAISGSAFTFCAVLNLFSGWGQIQPDT